MTCRHVKGDPNCGSTVGGYAEQARERERDAEREKERAKEAALVRQQKEELYARTPDKEKYEIVDMLRIGPHVVMKVLYPNCSKCSYEGNKVMVFLNVSEVDIIKWRVIDPHFRDPGVTRPKTQAPGPAARFPASKEGWADAVVYANGKNKT